MAYDWNKIRADYEGGTGGKELCSRYGVALSSLYRHAKAEGWTSSFNKEEPARSRTSVTRQHREEWAKQRELSERAVEEQDIELAKLAKLSAEILKIRQEGERRAWGISDKNEADLNGAVVLTWRK